MALGQEAELYFGTAGSTAGTLIDIVKMTDFTGETEAVSSSYRDSVWENDENGTQRLSGKIQLRRKVTDPGYVALKEAWRDRTAIALKLVPTNGSGEVIDADFNVKSWHPGPEDQNAVQEVEFDVKVNIDLREPDID